MITMNKKTIIIILAIVGIFLVLSSPAFAKEKVKVKITTEDYSLNNKGFIVIKLVDSKGKEIHSKGKINYTVTDSDGKYKWTSKSYDGEIRLLYHVGQYKVNVKFYGDSKYKNAVKTKGVTVKTSKFDAYTYYDNHNWGENSKIDEYIFDNYWYEEIYDELDDPENEVWDI